MNDLQDRKINHQEKLELVRDFWESQDSFFTYTEIAKSDIFYLLELIKELQAENCKKA